MPKLLSFSSVSKYQRCSQEWWWSYLGWEAIHSDDLNLRIGSAIHESFARYFQTGENPIISMKELSTKFGLETELKSLIKYVTTWYEDETIQRLKPLAIEKEIIDENLGFKGIVDFYGVLDDQYVIIDWKTSSKAYDQVFKETFDEQLTAYKWLSGIANWPIDKVGFCVIKKAALGNNKLQWVWIKRTDKHVQNYKNKIGMIKNLMAQRVHYPNPDEFRCSHCDYLELCTNGTENTKMVRLREGDF